MTSLLRLHLRSLLTVLLLLGYMEAADAPLQSVPPGRLSFRIYTAEQGLGNLTPWAMLQDRLGFIWLGTEDGLYRFDGQRFQAYGLNEGLPSTYVECLHEDPEGILWVGTYGGLARWTGRRFASVNLDPAAARLAVTALQSGPGGRLWVGTTLGPYVQDGADAFKPVQGWPGGRVSALWGRPDAPALCAAAWCGSRNRLLRFTAGAWAMLEGEAGFDEEKVDSLAVDGRGRTWARTLTRLWVLDAGGIRFRPSRHPVPPSRQKSALYRDPSGHVWVTTDQGLVQLRDPRPVHLGEAEGLPRAFALCLLVDREGSLWVGGADGVYRLQAGGIFRGYTTLQGLPVDAVWSILRDRDGSLLVGTDKGLARAGAGRFEALPGTATTQVRTAVSAPDGALWLAGGSHLLRLDPRTRAIQRFGPEAGILTGGRIYRILMDGESQLWVATDGGGLLRGTGRGTTWRFSRVVLPEESANEKIYDLQRDAAGHVWLAGDHGLAVLDGGTWKRFTTADGLRSNEVAYLCCRKDGSLVIAYFEPRGLLQARYADGRLQLHGHLDEKAPPGSVIYLVGEDVHRNLWVGTSRGLDRLGADGSLEHFGRAEGLVGENINAQAFHADSDGTVWFGTSNGLARFDATRYTGLPAPPETVILSVALGDQTHVGPPAVALSAPYRKGTFEVKFTALSFLREGALSYQVRLLDLESDWHFSDKREERYPGLAPGTYRFQVRARSGKGDWGPVHEVRFEILPEWWQTWWFKALLGLGALGFLALILRWRLAALRHRTRTLEAMVQERTRALEQANEALRNQSLTDPLTGLRNRRYLGVCLPEDIAQVHRVHKDLKASGAPRLKLNVDLVFALVDIDFFKSVNDQFGHSAGDIVLQQVAEILRAATRDSDTVVRWGGEEFLVVARNAARSESNTLVERIRSNMARHDFDLGNGKIIKRTCSVGFVFYPFFPDDPDVLSWERAVDLADHCLYAAKRAGRNTWVGLVPGGAADPGTIAARVPEDIAGLIAEDQLRPISSLGDVTDFDWAMKA